MIYANGDSWTSGWPDEQTFGHRRFSWPYYLSEMLEQPVLNDARAASSMSRIYRRTFDYLLLKRPKSALVFLTKWSRIELGNSETGKIHQYLPMRDSKFYRKHWHPYLAYSTFLRQIVSLQLAAQQSNTQLWLLDTYDNNMCRLPTLEWFKEILKSSPAFDAMDDASIESKFAKVQAINSLIDYNMFISDQSYQTLIDGCEMQQQHPVKDGHRRIAEYVYQYLISKGNIHGKTI